MMISLFLLHDTYNEIQVPFHDTIHITLIFHMEIQISNSKYGHHDHWVHI